jgi:hypothetical protein
MKLYQGLILLVLFSSCAGLAPNRTFIDVMDENKDITYFNPHEDFRVIPGDNGSGYRSRKEVLKRTPATEHMRRMETYNTSLDDELKYLESIQNNHAFQHYLKYREKLGGTSQRIYFLRIRSMNERDEYLEQIGLINNKPYYTESEYGEALRFDQILVGMTKEDVVSSLGRPIRRDVAGNPILQNERWSYIDNGRTKYIYFERGKVEGWATNDY